MKKLLELIRDSDTHVLSMAAALTGPVMNELAALVRLLIEKGVITQDELDAISDALKPEVAKTINEALSDMGKMLANESSEEESK